jgi:hypothetical protein
LLIPKEDIGPDAEISGSNLQQLKNNKEQDKSISEWIKVPEIKRNLLLMIYMWCSVSFSYWMVGF